MAEEINKVTAEDLEEFKDKISFWRNLSQILTDPDNGFTPEELEDFKEVDKDIFNPNLSDEEICLKAKEVYSSNCESDMRKYLFEQSEDEDLSWQEDALKIVEELYAEAEKRGWVVME